MLVKLRAITYGSVSRMPKGKDERPAIHQVITRGGGCTQIGFTSEQGAQFLQSRFPTFTSGSQLLLPWEPLNKG